MLAGARLTGAWSHDRAHAFFSRARWSPDILGVSLSHLIVRRLLPEGAALSVAVHRSGGHEDGLRRTRGDAAGTQSGSPRIRNAPDYPVRHA